MSLARLVLASDLFAAREAAAEARGAERALRDLTHEWQFKGWADVVPDALNSTGIPALAVGQAVTDWLRARAAQVAPSRVPGEGS